MMLYITNFTYKGWAIMSMPEHKWAKHKMWVACPPKYDPNSDNGQRLVTALGLENVKDEINAVIAKQEARQ